MTLRRPVATAIADFEPERPTGAPTRTAILIAGGAVLALVRLDLPGAALADTSPSGTTVLVESPLPVDPFAQVAAAIQWIGTLVIVIVVLAIAALLLSRIGGRAAAVGGPAIGSGIAASVEIAASPVRGIGWRGIILPLMWIAATVIGLLVGREIASEKSAGGFLAGLVVTVLAFLALAAIVIVGVLALIIRRGRPTRAIGAVLGAALLLAAGGIVGHGTAALTGGIYRAPVVLQASGEAHLALSEGGDTFVARPGGPVECTSGDDNLTVVSVSNLDLGELEGGTLRGSITLPELASDQGGISLFIDGADLGDGAAQATWGGPILVDALAPGGMSGTVRFDALAWADGAAKPGYPAPTLAGPWPATISGSFTWTCGPWGTNW